VKENESVILKLVLQKVNRLKESSPIIHIYSSFIADLITSMDIVQSMKDKGLSEKSIEDVLERAKSKIGRPGMRTMLQNIFFMDPGFALYKEKIQALLHALRSEELEKESENRRKLDKEISLAQLADEPDLEVFLDKASLLIASNSKYVKEIARLFDLQFNKPLLSIYKVLKFPIDRESFWKWMQKAPVPSKLLPEINTEITKLKNDLERDTGTGKATADYEELIKLIYDHTMCFTNKYKLLTETIKTHPEKQALLFCLGQIKNVHYKMENQFLMAVINQLYSCFSFSEVEKVLLEDRKKIDQRIEDYKIKLKKNIDKLLQDKASEKYRILPSVLKSVVEEKIISQEGFLQVDKKVNPERKLGFIVRLANSLIAYYFLLSLKFILVLWLKYFKSLRASDGIFIRHKLSSFTKEEIYELCSHYLHEKAVVVENLTKYLSWGKAEVEVRRHMLERLGAGLAKAAEIASGKYRLSGHKNGSVMHLRIRDEDNKVRFSNKTMGVNSYLDFLNVIRQNKLSSLINISDEQLKILFQNIHLDKIAELSSYIEERLTLLNFKNSLTALSAKEMEMELKKHGSEDGYLNELSASGDRERVLRSELLGKLEQELKETSLEDKEIIKRIRSEIENQQAALERIDLMMDVIRKWGAKQGQPEQVSIAGINNYLTVHRAAENACYLEVLLQKMQENNNLEAPDSTLTKTFGYLKKFQKPEVLALDNSVYEGKYESFAQAKRSLEDALLINSIEDNLTFLTSLQKIGEAELAARAAYSKKHGNYKNGTAQSLVYRREMEEQQAIIKNISKMLEFTAQETLKLKEVKKLNEAAAQKFKSISERLKEKDPAVQAEIIEEGLAELSDHEQKLGVAAQFLLASLGEEVMEKSKEIIAKGAVNRYKILVALYDILDRQEDNELKLKILDEFSRYLENNREDIYLRLKDLLDTQRSNLLNQYQTRQARISDLWRVLESLQKREEKIEYLNELLADDEWRMFYSYVENIKQGLLEENVDELLVRNRHLSLEEQYDLLQKIKIFRAPEYETKEINEKLSRKMLELEARRKVLREAKIKVFTPEAYSFITRIPVNEEKAIKSINLGLFKEERKAVETEFKAQGVSQQEVDEYLNRHLASPSDISTFREARSLEKQAAASKTEKERVAAFKEREDILSETQKRNADSENGKSMAAIDSLSDALKLFGPAQDGEEQEFLLAVQKLVENKKITEAVARIQDEVIWQSGKKGEIEKMSRLLFSIKELPSVQKDDEVNDFLTKQLQTLGSVIINEARKKITSVTAGKALPAEEAAVLEDSEAAGQENETPGRDNGELISKVEDKAKKDLNALILEMEGLPEFTDLSAFARQRDFKEEEEKRLAGIMNQLITKGKFIYLEKERKLLGTGRLKLLIERTFNEFSSGKQAGTDPYLLKKAWDFVRNKGGIQEQMRLLGVSSMEERSDLFKELEKMLQPHGTPLLKLSKKKLYQQKEVGQEDEKALPVEQKQGHKPAAKKDMPIKVRGHFAAPPKLKKKPKTMPKQKQASYSAATQKYIMHSFAPVIMDYMKAMYRNKNDFYIPISGKRQYYTLDILRRSVEGILRKDAKGKYHADLLESLKQDERLFSLLVSELFIEYNTGKGGKIYFPKFIKGEIKLG
jgi:hypothetical protein